MPVSFPSGYRGLVRRETAGQHLPRHACFNPREAMPRSGRTDFTTVRNLVFGDRQHAANAIDYG